MVTVAWILPSLSADMIKSMVRYVEEQSHNGHDDMPTATTSRGGNNVSPLMSFVMANDTNYKQKSYKPLLKRPTAGKQPTTDTKQYLS